MADEPLGVEVVYPPRGAFFPGEKTSLGLVVENRGDAPFDGSLAVSAPLGWTLGGAAASAPVALSLAPGAKTSLELELSAPAAGAARPCRNPLALRFRSGALAWTERVGLPVSIPCLLDGKPAELPTHDIPLSAAAATRFAVRFVVPARAVYRIVLCAPAAVRFSVDGAPVCDDSSRGVVSAIHRPTGAHADVSLAPGAHLLEAEIGPAAGAGGAPAAARLSVGEPSTWRLVSDLEYLPV